MYENRNKTMNRNKTTFSLPARPARTGPAVSLSGVALLATALLAAVTARLATAAALGFPAEQEDRMQQAVAHSSDRLAALRNVTETVPAPSAASRVAGCVELLMQEMKSPSSAGFGPGGGPVDTGYIQEVIMGSVCTFTQKEAERIQIRSILAKKLESTPSSDQALRDRLTIMLGSTGDVSVMPQLTSIMEHHPDGFMRYSAVMALREMSLDALRNSEECVSALKGVIEKDTYARIRFGDSHGPMDDSTTMVYSPSRNMAAEVLRRIGVPAPKGVEVVEAKYGVQRVEPLLYDSSNPRCIQASIEVLGRIGSIEARMALQTFIDKETEVAGMKQLVKEAQVTLDKLHLRQ